MSEYYRVFKLQLSDFSGLYCEMCKSWIRCNTVAVNMDYFLKVCNILIVICACFCKIHVLALHTCDINELTAVQSCSESSGISYDGSEVVRVPPGTICVHIVCGVLRHVECSTAGNWNGKDNKQCIPYQTGSEPRFDEGERKKRKKRWIFGGGRSPPPPPTAPPLAECGHPGNLPTATVTTTSTSQGGVATYSCNQGYRHMSGDLTRTCQSNSQWSGSEPTCSYMNSCSSNPCVNGGTCTNIPDSFTCSCPEIWKGTKCEEVALVCARNPCINHISCVDGSEIYTCVCKTGWSGQTCNIPVDCGQPGQVENCDIDVPATTLGHQVTYTCHDDYNMTTGGPTRECGTDGLWTGLQPDCIYAKSCQSGPCQNEATCINLLGDFRCVCLQGWTGKTCDIDIQPPVTAGCPDDIRVNATEKTRLVKWIEPTFVDPLGTEVVVESSYQEPEYIFPWGDFDIQYTATKPVNGLQSECVFKIIVRPTPCTLLEPPQNGALLCNNWSPEFGQICKIACRQNYTVSPTIKFRTWWICGANGHWSTPVPVPDCSINVLDSGDVLGYDSDYKDHLFTSCASLEDTRRLQDTYMDQMSRSGVSEFCNIYSDGCKAENVLVKCDET